MSVLIPAVGLGIALPLTSAFITDALPRKGDTSKEKEDKVRNLVASFFVGVAVSGIIFMSATEQQVPPEETTFTVV